MQITPTDIAFFLGFFGVVIGVSLWKSRRRAGHDQDSSDYFLAGRNLGWWVIGSGTGSSGWDGPVSDAEGRAAAGRDNDEGAVSLSGPR